MVLALLVVLVLVVELPAVAWGAHEASLLLLERERGLLLLRLVVLAGLLLRRLLVEAGQGVRRVEALAGAAEGPALLLLLLLEGLVVSAHVFVLGVGQAVLQLRRRADVDGEGHGHLRRAALHALGGQRGRTRGMVSQKWGGCCAQLSPFPP